MKTRPLASNCHRLKGAKFILVFWVLGEYDRGQKLVERMVFCFFVLFFKQLGPRLSVMRQETNR